MTNRNPFRPGQSIPPGTIIGRPQAVRKGVAAPQTLTTLDVAQQIAQTGTFALAGATPPALVVVANIYISKTGSDSNSGRSWASAFLTLGHAVKQAVKYNCGGNWIQINLGTGDWAESISVAGPLYGAGNSALTSGGILINGNGAPNTTISSDGVKLYTICVGYFGMVGIQNVTLSCTTSGGSTFFIQENGFVNVYAGVVFGPSSVSMVHTENAGSQVEFWDSITINGSAQYFLALSGLSFVEFNPVGSTETITITGGGDTTITFVYATDNSIVYFGQGWVIDGNVSGGQLWLDTGAQFVNASTATLPGSSVKNHIRTALMTPIASGSVLANVSGATAIPAAVPISSLVAASGGGLGTVAVVTQTTDIYLE